MVAGYVHFLLHVTKYYGHKRDDYLLVLVSFFFFFSITLSALLKNRAVPQSYLM
ncbi:hypothetical protein BDQ94DRAFT_144586 [Aspergillus welwitschiae]|uniref:Uncharacterized protein n=1 Tax=Aspergillus welwitschiae TaxID=1341132 RepID=A0A3F3Q085_9EURO|nr:hypothetical protein BDQ94DRAFT_144586 [Aspergillus welwitschiae]RDH32570.1 hypothetical protein BDQ94DRAFT_144586 [Aspergillus welwitschiae]